MDDVARISPPGPPTDIPSEEPRRAVARSRIAMRPDTLVSVATNAMKKGDVLEAARFAAIQAAKSAASHLPFAVEMRVATTTIEFTIGTQEILIEAVVEGRSTLGVEMPALSAAATAALTIYDMCKSADRTMTIGSVELIERYGDSATDWRNRDPTVTSG